MKDTTSHQQSEFNAELFLITIQNNLAQLKTRLKNDDFIRPWYLLLGAPQSGKTTLIEQAELLIHQRMTEESQYCQTWLTPNAIYFELPAFLLERDDEILWRKLFKLFMAQKNNSGLSGILLTVNMYNCCQQTTLEQSSLRILSLPIIKRLPIYLIYTHLDQLRGFKEFFDEVTATERQQPFGFFIPKDTYNKTKSVNSLFLQLCQQLSECLIRHLHQQRQTLQRSLIHDFPLQFESLGNVITPFVQQFFDHKPVLNLSGIFFTAYTKLGVTCDRLANVLTNHAHLPTAPHLSHVTTQRSYFTHDLLEKHLPSHRVTLNKNPNMTLSNIQAKSIIAVLCFLTIFCVAMFTQEFNHELSQLHEVNEGIKQSQHLLAHRDQENQHWMNEVLTLMTTLNKSKNHSLIHFLPDAINPFNDSQQLQALSQTTYQALRDKYFLPQLTHTLTSQMHAVNTTNDQLYNALKVYLMLAEPTHRQPEFVATWFQHYLNLNSNLDSQQQSQLVQQLKTILQQSTLVIDSDEQLITETRAKLEAQPKAFLAYSLLKASQLNNTSTEIPDNNPVFTPTRYHFEIPTIFSLKAFEKTYQHDIKQIVSSLTGGDWVLATKTNSHSVETNISDLVQQVQTLYIADYVNWWNLFIYNTRVVAFRNIMQAKEAFTNLENSNSLFTQLLQLIKANTRPIELKSEASDVFNTQIAKEFKAINKIEHPTSDSFHEIIKQINKKLDTLMSNNDNDQAVFELVKQRFNQKESHDPIEQLNELADKSPSPLKDWIRQLSNNYWHMLLFKMQHYIDQQWQFNVYSDYQSNIANRFPIAKQAADSINLENFTQFFSYDGKLDTFVTNYLLPFIDTNQPQWKMKSLQGSSFMLDEKFLQQLIRAKLIRKMFFNQASKKIDVKFSLKPLSFEPVIKDLTLTINGQSVFTYQGSDKISDFVWPGNSSASWPHS